MTPANWEEHQAQYRLDASHDAAAQRRDDEAEAADIEAGEARARREEADDRDARSRLTPAVQGLQLAARQWVLAAELAWRNPASVVAAAAAQRRWMDLSRASLDHSAAHLAEEQHAAAAEDREEALP